MSEIKVSFALFYWCWGIGTFVSPGKSINTKHVGLRVVYRYNWDHDKKTALQLRLKVEQSVSIDNENKRLTEKLKSFEETNRMLEDEIGDQNMKKKMVDEELKKLKEKYDTLQT